MWKVVAVVLGLTVAAGCSSGGGAHDPILGDYTISSGDRIMVVVDGEKDLSGQFTVDADGTVLIPIAGPLPVAGLSLGDAASAYAAKLRDGQILRAPKVVVEAVDARPILVLGEVKRPGQYAFANGLTVRGAINLAEGVTYYAKHSTVEITRAGRTVEVDLDIEVKILPGDTVRVPRRFF